jgi:DNA-3-methyladenine glycosylase I
MFSSDAKIVGVRRVSERCGWCGTDPLYCAYHDTEWGVPEFDGRALWEKLILDGFQAGLSWITILRKRDAFRAAFAGFDPHVVATWGEAEVVRLLGDPGIVRHRGKIEATIGNARAYERIEAEGGFADFLWSRAGGGAAGEPVGCDVEEVPTTTPMARTDVRRTCKKAGFRFCGPTITYAFMQATGMVNDHIVTCPRHGPVAGMGKEPPM